MGSGIHRSQSVMGSEIRRSRSVIGSEIRRSRSVIGSGIRRSRSVMGSEIRRSQPVLEIMESVGHGLWGGGGHFLPLNTSTHLLDGVSQNAKTKF